MLKKNLAPLGSKSSSYYPAFLNLKGKKTVVIGGGSLNGGEGSVIGSLAGAVIMTTIRAGSNDR